MITLEPVRSDTLPENTLYNDDGCDVSASCLNCPLPVCKFDDPGWLRRATRHERDRSVIAAYRGENLSANDLAARFQVSARTIHRILQSERTGALALERVIPESPVARLDSRRHFRSPAPLPPIRLSERGGFDAAVGF